MTVTPKLKDELTRIYKACSVGGEKNALQVFVYKGKTYTDKTPFDEFPEELKRLAREIEM